MRIKSEMAVEIVTELIGCLSDGLNFRKAIEWRRRFLPEGTAWMIKQLLH
jgi:hypothetical protein